VSSINSITISGRLGRDPETRQTQSGKSICSFSVAVDRRGKDAGTDWFAVTVWERLGELCQEFLTKGRHVTISGRMQSRQYEKDGQKVTAWDLVANDVDFGPRTDAQDNGAPPRRQASPATRQTVQQAWGPLPDDDGVPF
jgi:single-strand DNA-binding protein